MNTIHRPIRSFVLRQGRVSNAQQRAHQTLLPQFGIPYAPGLIDLDHVFGRRASKILEIGFGMGETTAAIAALHPENDYLGIEVHTPGVGSLLKAIDAEGLTNVRIVQHDAVEVLCHMIAHNTFDGVHVFFPDPWPKKRHHKRRLIQAEFAALAARALRAGGRLHLATDWAPYAEHMRLVLDSCPLLAAPAAAPGSARPMARAVTRFESRGLRLGHEVSDLMYERR
jgi:tRNA (guanine-N7-)-methyltransferase